MKLFAAFTLWCLLFVVSWPAAIFVLILFPVVWLVLLPFRVAGAVVSGMFSLIRAIFSIPARLLGLKKSS